MIIVLSECIRLRMCSEIRGKARPVAEGGVGFERPDGQGHAFAGRGLRGVGYGIVTGDAEIFFEVLTLFVGQRLDLAKPNGRVAHEVVDAVEEEGDLRPELDVHAMVQIVDAVDAALPDQPYGKVRVIDAEREIADLPALTHSSGSHDFWIGLEGPDTATFEFCDEISSGHGVERSNVYDLDSARSVRRPADATPLFEGSKQAMHTALGGEAHSVPHFKEARRYSARAIDIARKVGEQAALLCGEGDHAAIRPGLLGRRSKSAVDAFHP
jgi:hypothetical protein